MGFSFDPAQFPTVCDFCCATPELYRLSAPVDDGFRVAAFEDDTCIWIGDTAGPGSDPQPVAKLDAQEVYEGAALQRGDVLWTNNKRISGSAEEGAADIALMPAYAAGTDLWFSWSRSTRPTITVVSLGGTSVDIFFGGTLQTTLAMAAGGNSVYNPTTGGNLYGAWRLVANGPILAFKQQTNSGNNDSSPVMRAAAPGEDLLTWHSNSCPMVGPAGTVFSGFDMEGSNAPTVTANANGLGTFNAGTFGNNAANDNWLDPRGATRIIGASGGNQRGDNDGGNDTPAMPVGLLATHHLIPQPTEYISFVAEGPATVQRFDPATGALAETQTLTRTSTQPLAPYGYRFGTPNGASNLPAGQLFIASEGVHCAYQPKGSGTFGSDDDETVSFGYNL